MMLWKSKTYAESVSVGAPECRSSVSERSSKIAREIVQVDPRSPRDRLCRVADAGTPNFITASFGAIVAERNFVAMLMFSEASGFHRDATDELNRTRNSHRPLVWRHCPRIRIWKRADFIWPW